MNRPSHNLSNFEIEAKAREEKQKCDRTARQTVNAIIHYLAADERRRLHNPSNSEQELKEYIDAIDRDSEKAPRRKTNAKKNPRSRAGAGHSGPHPDPCNLIDTCDIRTGRNRADYAGDDCGDDDCMVDACMVGTTFHPSNSHAPCDSDTSGCDSDPGYCRCGHHPSPRQFMNRWGGAIVAGIVCTFWIVAVGLILNAMNLNFWNPPERTIVDIALDVVLDALGL